MIGLIFVCRHKCQCKRHLKVYLFIGYFITLLLPNQKAQTRLPEATINSPLQTSQLCTSLGAVVFEITLFISYVVSERILKDTSDQESSHSLFSFSNKSQDSLHTEVTVIGISLKSGSFAFGKSFIYANTAFKDQVFSAVSISIFQLWQWLKQCTMPPVSRRTPLHSFIACHALQGTSTEIYPLFGTHTSQPRRPGKSRLFFPMLFAGQISLSEC